jgi:signal transduction histidine kinase
MFRNVLMVTLGLGLFAHIERGRHRGGWRRDSLRLSDDLRDRFLATVSHELRTPLNAILGWAQALKAGRLLPSEMPRAFDAIDRNARAEARLVDDLLDVSRMRSGRLSISRHPINLVGVVDDVVADMRQTATDQGIGLCYASRSTPIHVWGDRARLRQLVGHLVANSVKFTPAGGWIAVQVDDEGASAVLRVQDSGVGIAADHLPRIVEPFYQGTPGPRRPGLGLGLTLVTELLALHNGTMKIDSEGTGTGTLVVVRLPITRAPS